MADRRLVHARLANPNAPPITDQPSRIGQCPHSQTTWHGSRSSATSTSDSCGSSPVASRTTARAGTTLVREGENSGVGFFVIADGTAAVSVGRQDRRHDRPRRLLRRACDDYARGPARRNRHRRDAPSLPLDPVLGLPSSSRRTTPTSPGSCSSTSPAYWQRIGRDRPPGKHPTVELSPAAGGQVPVTAFAGTPALEQHGAQRRRRRASPSPCASRGSRCRGAA